MNALPNHPTPHDARPSFRLSNPLSRITLGAVASAAVFAASALVFGPVSDQRTLAMAGSTNTASNQYAGVVDNDGRPGAPHQLAAATPRADERGSVSSLLAHDLRASAN